MMALQLLQQEYTVHVKWKYEKDIKKKKRYEPKPQVNSSMYRGLCF